jgi:hypothetical protein
MSLVLDTGAMKYRENPSQPWRPLVIKANMNWESLADTYDPDNGTYEVGQYVLEDGAMYRCISEINTPETWTAAHWTEINIGDELFSLQGSINQLIQESAFEIVEENGEFKLYWYGAQGECPYTIVYENGVYNLYFNYTTA